MLGGPSLQLGIPIERLSIPPGIGWGEKDTGRLVTWEFPPRIDSASWKSLEIFIQLNSFCNSWFWPVSSRIVSWSSTNLLLVIVSMVELWNFCNSSVALRLLRWASRSSEFCCNNCYEEVVDLVFEVRLLEHDEVLSAETRSFHSIFVHFLS